MGPHFCHGLLGVVDADRVEELQPLVHRGVAVVSQVARLIALRIGAGVVSEVRLAPVGLIDPGNEVGTCAAREVRESPVPPPASRSAQGYVRVVMVDR